MRDNGVYHSYSGSQVVDGVGTPMGVIGYACKVEDVAYRNGSLRMSVNSGLPSHEHTLTGHAAEAFMNDMGVTPDRVSGLVGRAVSVRKGEKYLTISKRN